MCLIGYHDVNNEKIDVPVQNCHAFVSYVMRWFVSIKTNLIKWAEINERTFAAAGAVN